MKMRRRSAVPCARGGSGSRRRGARCATRSGRLTKSPLILLEGTIVTMNAAREVIQHGYVLVRDGRIAAVWKGAHPPDGVDLSGVVRAPSGRGAHIYPGLINLHDHPFYDVLPLWQPPSSHRQPELGQADGDGAIWQPISVERGGLTQPEEAARLISHPSTILTSSDGLGRLIDVIKFGRARMILGARRQTQGGDRIQRRFAACAKYRRRHFWPSADFQSRGADRIARRERCGGTE